MQISLHSGFTAIFLLIFAPLTVLGGNSVYYTTQSDGLFVDTGKSNATPDTAVTATDTAKADSFQAFPLSISPDTLDDQVLYKATDSAFLDIAASKFYLYGDAEVKYQDIELKAAEIVFDWKQNTVTATGSQDSLGQPVGKPNFKEGDRSFDANKMAYNFKTKQGKIYDLMTQEGEGFLHTREAKKMESEEIYARRVQYTTCDLEHPHFYLEANPAKVIPNELLVSGPANLVITGVRTPFVLPFALFPLKKEERQSGLIIPQVANTNQFGYGLTRGGYYLGLSDYFDLELTGDLYSSGSWGLHASSSFKKRYKYSGNIGVDYSQFKTGSVFTDDLRLDKQFRVKGAFRIDPKAWPNNRFNMNLSFGSSGSNNYSRFNETDLDQRFNNTYQSSISYSHDFPADWPLSFNASARYTQKVSSGTIDLTLPEMFIGLSSIFPFERDNTVSQERWYDGILEPIKFSWNINSKNRVSTTDSMFFTRQTFENLEFGVSHKIPVSSTYKMLKYVTFSPSVNYNENWYVQSYDHFYEPRLTGDSTFTYVQTDTSSGFTAVRYWSYSARFQTNLYGFLRFKDRKVKAIRHKATPSVSVQYNPSFTDEYYQDVRTNPEGDRERYATFPSLYSNPPTEEFGGVSLGLNNNVEMKVADEKDTVDGEKKITLIDNLNLSTRYNMVLDSLNWGPIVGRGYSYLFNRKVDISYGFRLDPYAVNEKGQRIRTTQQEAHGKLLRFVAANVAIGTNFSSQEVDGIDIPLNLGINYRMDVNKGGGINADSLIFDQNVRVNLSLTPTPNWTVSTDFAYDIDREQISGMNLNIRRDLHCWYMSFHWSPVGFAKQYTFTIQAKSSLLEDLKLKKKSDPYQNFPQFQ